MIRSPVSALAGLLLFAPILHADEVTLSLPPVSESPAAAGAKVALTPPEFHGTGVHHMLYLPSDWSPDWKEQGHSWPVIVEYTGNRFPESGSTGRVEDAALGYGISAGRFIWVVLPFVAGNHKENALTWWGDVEATVDYAKTNVPRVCAEFGGDRNAVFLCGFSRGAIAVNFIGLHDDEIARLWRGFITHDHYDGVKEWKGTPWGSPLAVYRASAEARMRRLAGRPVLVCQNQGDQHISEVEKYVTSHILPSELTFLKVDVRGIFKTFPNETARHPHTDRWLLQDSAERRVVWLWLEHVLKTRPK